MKGGAPTRSGVHLSDQVARIIDDMGYASSKVTENTKHLINLNYLVSRLEIDNYKFIKIYII